MKRIFITFFFITLIAGLYSQTNVSGNQSGIWTSADSPYSVIGNITVPPGEILTIEAGVTVSFQGHYKITVLGTLNAQGTNNKT